MNNNAAAITIVVLSGDGKVAYVATGIDRLIKIDVDTGTRVEIIVRTPFLRGGTWVGAGMVVRATGNGPSETALQGTPPLNPWLGNRTIWMGEHKVPVFAVSPTEVGLVVPWDTPAATNTPRSQASIPRSTSHSQSCLSRLMGAPAPLPTRTGMDS